MKQKAWRRQVARRRHAQEENLKKARATAVGWVAAQVAAAMLLPPPKTRPQVHHLGLWARMRRWMRIPVLP